MENLKNKIAVLLAVMFTVVAVWSCNNDDDVTPVPDEQAPTLVAAAEDANLTTLLEAVDAAGVGSALLNAEEITVFAPTNQAFDNLIAALDGVSNLDELVAFLGGAPGLANVLQFHVIPSRILAANVPTTPTEVLTLNGETITVQRSGESVSITDKAGNTVSVVTADVNIANGVVHVIDGVLLPDLGEEEVGNIVEVATAAGLTTLLAAVEAAGVGQTLLDAADITVFAPTNDAFSALIASLDGVNDLNGLVEFLGGVEGLANVLQFHVVPSRVFAADVPTTPTAVETLNGETITVQRSGNNVTITDQNGNTVNVAAADVAIQNGVVHVIDGVLLPDLGEEEVGNIVEVATAAGLTTLLAAVEAASVGQTLLDAADITVFAPTNDAFAALIASLDGVNDLNGLVEFLGGVEGLANVLQFHVVPSRVFSADVPTSPTAVETLNGETITVQRSGDNVSITDQNGNTVNVAAADVAIQNGVVHVIDGVLLPTLESAQDNVLTLREDSEFGPIFTDANGRPLYYFARDVNGLNNCTGGCAENWPIFFADNIDISNPSFDQSLIGTIEVNGQSQTTYNGWPLYYFANDNNGTTVNGDGVGSVWYVAKPNYSIMVANGQLVGNDGQNYIINNDGQYVVGTGNTQYFIDFASGRTLYRFVNDEADQSNFGGNANIWPKYTTTIQGLPSILAATDLNIIADNQISFKGNPLYKFGSDEGRGDTKGVSVPNPGVWPIVNSNTPVLAPLPSIVEAAQGAGLTTLLAAVEAAGVGQTLLDASDITVFAPTNDAFAALIASLDGVNDLNGLVEFLGGVEGLANVLQFHVVPARVFAADVPTTPTAVETLNGETITVQRIGNNVSITDQNGNTVNVAAADVAIQNGVVHVIDGVLLPDLGAEEEVGNIVEVATAAGLTTLLAAVEAAGVGQALLDAEAITVFAPTNDAFAALIASLDGVDSLEDLVSFLGGTSGLANVLQYHVIPSAIFAADVPTAATDVTTLNGETISVIRDGNNVTITDQNGVSVTVVTADVRISNGVVHVINGVLLPELD